MKNQKKNYALRVGLLVGAGILIFVFAIFFIGKQQNLFGSTALLKAIFPNVSGLQIGNNVRFNGINIGTVNDIFILSDTAVIVHMLIEKDKLPFIRTNSRSLIGSEGLMGDKIVTITSGDDSYESVKENATLRSEPPIEIDAIMGNLKNTVENAEIISSELAMIVFKVNNGNGVLSKMISDTTMSADFASTLENLKNSSASLDENLSAVKESFLLRGAIRKMEKEKESESKKNRKNK